MKDQEILRVRLVEHWLLDEKAPDQDVQEELGLACILGSQQYCKLYRSAKKLTDARMPRYDHAMGAWTVCGGCITRIEPR